MRDFSFALAMGSWVYFAYLGYGFKDNELVKVLLHGFNALMFMLLYIDTRQDKND